MVETYANSFLTIDARRFGQFKKLFGTGLIGIPIFVNMNQEGSFAAFWPG